LFQNWRYRDRMILALAIAVAVHEVFLSLVHGPAHASDREDTARTTRVVFETPRPSPTPRPTPRPTPTPRATPRPTPPPTPPPRVTPPPHSTPAPVQQVAGKAKGAPARHRGGGARHAIVAKAAKGNHANPKAHGAGTGGGTGRGSGAGAGNGGGAGGNGAGNGGNGNGAVNANTPCGVVEFKPTGAPRYDNGTAHEPIQATVTFPDGHAESANFPYRWTYPNGEQTDPWSDTNLKKGDFPITMQTPPPGTDVTALPPLIQYIVQHTGPTGYTDLPDCPKRG
jgi:hypothetical protein